MKKLLIVLMTFAILFTLSTTLFAGGKQEAEPVMEVDNSVEVIHWWTSGGEAAALNVLKEDLEAQGIEWIDAPNTLFHAARIHIDSGG